MDKSCKRKEFVAICLPFAVSSLFVKVFLLLAFCVCLFRLCWINRLFCCVYSSETDIFDREGWSTWSATETLSMCQFRLRRDKYNKKDSFRDQIFKTQSLWLHCQKLKKNWTETYKPQNPLKSCHLSLKSKAIKYSSQIEQLNVQTPMTSWFVKCQSALLIRVSSFRIGHIGE